MTEQVADTLQQIVSLFQLTKPLAIPQMEGNWIIMDVFDLAEAAALTLAISFFLRRLGNRAEQLHQPKKSDLLLIRFEKENYHD
jgi:hypothetical protein